MKKLNILNTVFFLATPLIAIVGCGLYLWLVGITWVAAILFFAMLTLTLMSISAGYHRLFSHRTHDAAGWLKVGYLLFGAASFQESCLRWASDHRLHHRFVDTDQDPYNIKAGPLWAHIGWIFYDQPDTRPAAKDLKEDRLVAWQDRNWIWIGILVGFGLPTAIGALFGDPLGGLLFGGFLRLVVAHHLTFMINSLAHLIGSQPFSDENTARDSWISAIFTFGEGYHNFHHFKPGDYRNGLRSYHWDPPKWFIISMSWIGQTWNLNRTPEDEIFRARIAMDRRRIASPHEILEAEGEKLLHVVEELSNERRNWTAAIQRATVGSISPEISRLREKFLEARRHCRQSYKAWRLLLREIKKGNATLISGS